MSSKHERLVSAISDARETQGFTWKQVAMFAGVSQGTISAVVNQGYQLKDERWKMICEHMGLNYEEIVSDAEPIIANDAAEKPPEEKNQQEQPSEECGGDKWSLLSKSEDSHLMDVAARYMASHLKEDVLRGMDVSLEDLHALLTVCKRLQAAAELK